MDNQVRQFYLYKFFEEEEYRKMFIDGELFCNTARWVADTENKTSGVVDEFENAKIISISDNNHLVQHEIVDCKNGSARVYFRAYKKKTKNYRDNQAFISFHNENYNLFCMSTIWVDENAIVTEFDKSNINNFGEYGVLIFNVPKFKDIICNSINLNPTIKECFGNPVNYVSYKNRNSVQHWDIWNKFDWYKEQQEFRLVFNNLENSILQYKLSQDLSSIVAVIPNKKDFFKNVSVGQSLFSAIKIIQKN